MEKKNAWLSYDEATAAKVEAFAKEYCAYIDGGKTERECVTLSVAASEKKGFKDLMKVVAEGGKLTAGDRVYVNWMNKCYLAFIVGSKPLCEGMNIVGAHIDSPRIDIKQNPIFEDGELAYLDTHYYGGIKKYQWLALPLALHGVVAKKDGTIVTIAVGEDEADPVFYISDLLPHLGADQMSKTASKLIEGEALDLIVGSKPVKGEDEKASVAEGVKAILLEKYGIEEEDFESAELEIVPAGKARDIGFDRALIAAYGHDDRVCAYPSMMALLNYEGTPEYTACAVLCDKEEIGSVGATGMNGRFFENIVAELYNCCGGYSELNLRRALANSRMLSSDVSAAFDPNFAGAFEKKNTAFVGHGVCFSKFTGRGGKGGSNDANAEFIGGLRKVMADNGVNYQFCELGRVDQGGGGTIAYICANYGMSVIDAGVPVLSMHAPWEAISKADLYEAYKCYCAFVKDAKPVKY